MNQDLNLEALAVVAACVVGWAAGRLDGAEECGAVLAADADADADDDEVAS